MTHTVTAKSYAAVGDGVHDDTDAIQRALDAVVGGYDPATGRPRVGNNAANPSNDTPVGGRVYLPGGGATAARPTRTYRVTRPLRVWGMTTVYGDGWDTMVDGREIPAGRSLFELQHLEIGAGSWWHSCSRFHDFSLVCGGHGFGADADARGGAQGSSWSRLWAVCRGFGIFLPGYSQSAVVEDVTQANPCSGGLVLAGNKNTVRRYAVVRGYGGWDGKQGFRSPWLDGRGQVDVGGQNNLVEQCHVEHALPMTGGTVDPKDAVVPFRFWSTDPGTWGGWQDVVVNGNWPEFQQPGAVVDGVHVRCERVATHGYLGEPQGVRVAGNVRPGGETNAKG